MGKNKNRYLLFGGQCYYALGGHHDFIGAFKSLDDAVAEGRKLVNTMGKSDDIEWYHVFDTELFEIVAESNTLCMV